MVAVVVVIVVLAQLEIDIESYLYRLGHVQAYLACRRNDCATEPRRHGI